MVELEDRSLKIFGIGLSKTGTRSLYEACKILGFRTCHYEVTKYSLTRYENGKDVFFLDYAIDEYDAFFDHVWRRWEDLAIRFPDAKFILSQRNITDWINSRIIHNYHNRIAPDYVGSSSDINTLNWRTLWKNHNENVQTWFAQRDFSHRLLKINVCAGEGWEKLCPFLGKPIPDQKFPMANSQEMRLVNILHYWRERNPELATMSDEPGTPDVFCKSE